VIAAIETLLAPRAGVKDPHATLAGDVIESMRHFGPHTRVEQLAVTHHLAPRTLQRLFRRYVGVRPKWVLKRLRIHQAAEQLAGASSPAWTDLALSLGYYDHAHFIRDFRLVVGRSPAEYAAEAALALINQGFPSPAQRRSQAA
jgi:transcriptional regulator GlxA family with amidase domain